MQKLKRELKANKSKKKNKCLEREREREGSLDRVDIFPQQKYAVSRH
jgi:hypothetical protein